MKLLLKLSWRNLWRNKRRTLITATAVAFAVMLAIAMRGIQLGTYEVNIRYVAELFSGYLQIQSPGYQDNPSLQKSFRYDEFLIEILDQHPRIVNHAPRVIADGLVSYRDNSLGAALIGIDPQRELNTSEITKKIYTGHFIESTTSTNIVIGYKLLENLHAKIGDEIVVLAQGYDGSLGNQKFTIIGTLKTGSAEIDAMAIFMGIETAQELVTLYGKCNTIAIRLEKLSDISDVRDDLAPLLHERNLDVLPWSEVMPDLKQAIELDNISGLLFLAILLLVVAFGITNTVLMSVTERFREFGIVLSLGMPQITLVSIVILETIFIAFIGVGIGNILAAGINTYIVHNPIVFSGEFEAIYAEYGFLPRIESSLEPTIFVNHTLIILLVALFAAIYPLIKVFRLEPLKGIRYT